MKKILLAGTIALMATSGAAFAQTADQTGDASATGGQGGMNTPSRVPVERPYYEPAPGVTTGMGSGEVIVVRPAPVPEAAPIGGGPYDGESTQGNVGPGAGYDR